jgi:hypothetical protein
VDTARPRLEVADLVRAAGGRLNQDGRLSLAQGRVLQHIATCRTVALGGHVDQCDGCGHQRPSYNSCRDRHCPKCQASARARWLDQRLARLLPVPYFHVVFTVPDELNQVLLRNQRRGYSILFAAASASLQELAADPRRLGAQLAITAVLHTWGQSLRFHPHLHCVVSGGGLSLDGRRWVTGREHYLLPVHVLAKLFRGKFLAALEDAYQHGQLDLSGTCAELTSPVGWAAWRDQLYRTRWVVYAKPPFGGPEVVFRYLGRYTHRVAISNQRLVALTGDRVSFMVKDYADHGRRKTMTLSVEQFLRRFLLHVLPGGFVRIRHYGLVAGRNVTTKLALVRRLLAKRKSRCQRAEPARPANLLADPRVCPACGQSRWRRLVILPETSHRWASNLARASPSILVVAT